MKKAFTLIELLIVIAIIVILAAVLFPVFAQARAKAKQTVCASNSRQLATALLIYAQDFDENTVILWRNFSQPSYPGWAQRLFPYVNNNAVFHCPAGPKSVPDNVMSFVVGGAGTNLAGNP